MLIITVFILAFGVPTYSLLHDVQKFSWHIPRQIINLAYWEIFGELDTVDDVKSSFHPKGDIHENLFLLVENYEIHGYVMFFLLVAYTIIASVLLINLLIAMFRYCFPIRGKKNFRWNILVIHLMNYMWIRIICGNFNNIR